ncbi:MAG: septum site-determining protein MinD [Deltaproteobacteria bacterium]|nr:septum site-determining protein MinD [Deltaproteobacteria bacterium]
MGRIIVITSGKGGVGKTTATANIGTALAMMGNEVVLVDADIGLRNLDIIMGLEGRVVYTSMDIVEGVCDLHKALVKGRVENLRLLAASQRNSKNDFPIEYMKKICTELSETYDYVLIDSPAGIEQGFQMSAEAADEAVIITTPEVTAIRDADRIIGLVQSIGIDNLSLVVNRLSVEMIENGNMMGPEDIIEVLAIPLLGVVPEDKDIIIATNKGAPLILSKNSKSGEAYKRIARRVNGEDNIPIPDLKEASWFPHLIKKIFRAGEGG